MTALKFDERQQATTMVVKTNNRMGMVLSTNAHHMETLGVSLGSKFRGFDVQNIGMFVKCIDTMQYLAGDCVYIKRVDTYPCQLCRPGLEFFDTVAQTCVTCSAVICAEDEEIQACCGNTDTQCVKKIIHEIINTCNNNVHDYGEQCDLSDKSSPLWWCCTDKCTLKGGFYATPPCQTVCGDGVLAVGREECDDPNSFLCDMTTCKKRK